jgi:hypothetical protein
VVSRQQPQPHQPLHQQPQPRPQVLVQRVQPSVLASVLSRLALVEHRLLLLVVLLLADCWLALGQSLVVRLRRQWWVELLRSLGRWCRQPLRAQDSEHWVAQAGRLRLALELAPRLAPGCWLRPVEDWRGSVPPRSRLLSQLLYPAQSPDSQPHWLPAR